MFRFAFKVIQISIFAGSLLLLNTTLLAQDFAPVGVDGVPGIHQKFVDKLKSDSNKANETNSKSTLSGVSEDSNSNMMGSITMLAVGFITSRLATYEKKTTDMMIAAVGGAAFIVGEIVSSDKFKQATENDIQDYLKRLNNFP